MADITLISGSTLGSAEYVAEHLAELLEKEDFSTEILHGPELSELPESGIWLVVTSTHGAGEFPDNLKTLFEQLAQQKTDLSQIRFGAVGIGSKEYDTFCGAILTADRVLTQSGARRIGDVLTIDITEHQIPEDPAEIWLGSWIDLLKKD
ncbi:FMN-binding protein MioC [Samsonia erythrinae]|uniref:MioC protein n=1 Tax=Samsonia erythrinae TaxID=160434 RepID=A0A4R3VHF4_9GAMM|nr:FMN-binding protein MioC [Samsonia erythrinae]TCV04947.1 MioC protein [Samsonia erythrinae]